MSHPGDTGRASAPLDLLWRLEEIGGVIRRNRRQTHYLLEKGELPGARKIGGRWCISLVALQAVFGLAREAA